MQRYFYLFERVISLENLTLAYKKARKNKTTKSYVLEFEKNIEANILELHNQLVKQKYFPKKLVNFVIREPKTRVISKSAFRDRIVHHAICNIIEPIFDKCFICDSFANRIGKGTLNAIHRFDYFKRKVTKNNLRKCYVLKADIHHYFESVNHQILIKILSKKIKDEKLIYLIRCILLNHHPEIGMPLGNLTSQFFANVYLNELDQYIKTELRVKYYIRYVDDFVILSENKNELRYLQKCVHNYLESNLKLQLHPNKTKIHDLDAGVQFLGMRIFYHHKLLKKSNIRKFRNKLKRKIDKFTKQEINYDEVYDLVEGWIAHIENYDCYNEKRRTLSQFRSIFKNEVSTKEFNRLNKIKNKN